jgi:hypothetical protein
MNTILNAQLVTQSDSKSDGAEEANYSRITDFFEARHEMFLGGRETAKSKQGIHSGATLRYESFSQRHRTIEQGLYWLISAPALGYLIYLPLGYSNGRYLALKSATGE